MEELKNSLRCKIFLFFETIDLSKFKFLNSCAANDNSVLFKFKFHNTYIFQFLVIPMHYPNSKLKAYEKRTKATWIGEEKRYLKTVVENQMTNK